MTTSRPVSGKRLCYEVFLNYNCNAKCLFCSQENFDKSLNAPLRDILRRVLTGYKEGYARLGFTGGEPLLHPDVIKVVAFAKAAGFTFIRMQTNGIRLADKKFAAAIAKAGLTFCKFSPQSLHPQVHDRLVGVPGAFEKVLKGMENLRALEVRLGMNIVISAQNYRELPEIMQFFLERGISDFVLIYPLVMGGYLRNIKTLGVPLYDAVPYIERALDLLESHGIPGLCLNVPPCFLNRHHQNIILGNFNTVITDPTGRRVDLDENRHEDRMHGAVCSGCLMKGRCSGADRQYIKHWGWKDFAACKTERPEAAEVKKNRPAQKPVFYTDNDRCFIKILKLENDIPTARVLALAKDIALCRDCTDGNAVLTAGEKLAEAGLLERSRRKGSYYWRLLREDIKL